MGFRSRMSASFRKPRNGLACFLAFFPLFMCHGQTYLGFGTGVAINKLSHSGGNVEFAYRSGLMANVYVAKQIGRRTAIVLEGGFVQKGYGKRAKHSPNIREETVNDYLVFSPAFRLYGIRYKCLSGFAEAGPYTGYWLNTKTTGRYPNVLSVVHGDDGLYYSPIVEATARNDFDKRRDNRFDVGVTLAVGSSVRLGRSLLEAKIGYAASLIGQQKRYMREQEKKTNRSFSFGICYAFMI